MCINNVSEEEVIYYWLVNSTTCFPSCRGLHSLSWIALCVCVCDCTHVFIFLCGHISFKYYSCEDVLLLGGHFKLSSCSKRILGIKTGL